MESKYLSPDSDGLPTRDSGLWAIEKLDYLRRYIDVFITSMRSKKWRAIHFIDLFAGPGKCSIRKRKKVVLGSPLLALTAKYAFSGGYFFVDLDPDNMQALRLRCASSSQFNRIRFFQGDANVVVNAIVRQLEAIDQRFLPGVWSSLNLAFLDPQGIDLHWDTVVTLSGVRKMDLIIHYPQGGLNECMHQLANTNRENKVDLFFGATEWRDIYLRRAGRRDLHRALIDLYKGRLRDLGYREVRLGDEAEYEPLMRNTARKAPLYRLLFASRDALGHEFWDDVASRDVHGQTRLFELAACEPWCYSPTNANRSLVQEQRRMAAHSRIEWTECTWNPLTGCTKVSAGCTHCYAERMARRLQGMGQRNYRNGFTLTLHPAMLDLPLKWKRPHAVFVNSMSDLFHEDVPVAFIQDAFDVMRRAHWHVFQILTKRSRRLAEVGKVIDWPDNVWMGVTVESTAYRSRILDLQKSNARVKWLSLEPLLGPLGSLDLGGIHWVVVGGESGPGARPMDEDWAASIRDQCVAAHVPFFFKQWGGVRKHRAGRVLQGRTWDERPAFAGT